MTPGLRPAAIAFDAAAPNFDMRFGNWRSVEAQRRAVRAELLRTFPEGSRLLEVGGGTGIDAAFLAERGFEVLLTDPSPAMVELANTKLVPLGSQAKLVAAEDLDEFASRHFANDAPPFDGAFSNFAPLNCVTELRPVARGLARLLRPGSSALLVVFGTLCPGEAVVEALRGRPHLALRRRKRGRVAARLATFEFDVVYHRRADLARVFAPWFTLEERVGIGIAVPPSAAEPWISGHPRLLAALERLDRIVARPLALLGDHVLYHFRRTDCAVNAPRPSLTIE